MTTIPTSMRFVLMVALGSALGGVARHWVGNALGDAVHVPWRTFVINVTGSFILGAFLQWSEQQNVPHPSLRAFVAIGLCGGYTTFSTYSYEVTALLQTGAVGRAMLYAGGSVVVSVAATFAGILAARMV